MKYENASEILPAELLSAVQKYYQGGYLYIPKDPVRRVKQLTDYQIELEKRNQHIYLKYLEGKSNGQLGKIYHLSGSSVRRIIAKEKVRYRDMKEIIEQLLPLWGMETGQLMQIYPSTWEINHSHMIKVYENQEQLERNIKISEILSDCNIPVAKAVPTKTGEPYATHQNRYFLLSEKLRGSNNTDIKDKMIAQNIGCAIALLHMAFLKCEKEIAFWDNSLLKEMKGWIRKNLADNKWQILSREEYVTAVSLLESMYDHLPRQLIHRDVHFGNFLFFEGTLSGYIDFDLSQRNIRIFDICYFLAGLLAEETETAFTKEEWLGQVNAVIEGYESINPLSIEEKAAIPCVMECIEILFVAYFIGIKDIKQATEASRVFRFIRDLESDIGNCLAKLHRNASKDASQF